MIYYSKRIQSKINTHVKCPPGKFFTNLVPLVFTGGWSRRHPLPHTGQNSRLPEKKEVFIIVHIVQFRSNKPEASLGQPHKQALLKTVASGLPCSLASVLTWESAVIQNPPPFDPFAPLILWPHLLSRTFFMSLTPCYTVKLLLSICSRKGDRREVPWLGTEVGGGPQAVTVFPANKS